MVIRDEKPGFPGDAGEWKDRKRRDDTPSFIRDVQARAELLNPHRGRESIPVLAMPTSVRLWRRFRWPLFVSIVLFVLAIIGVFTKNQLVGRNVRNEIAGAEELESAASIEGLLGAHRTLSALAKRQTDKPNAQAAHAWLSILLGELFGPAEAYLEAAAPSLDRLGADPGALGRAARAGAAHLRGADAEALKAAEDGLAAHPGDARLLLVKSWALRDLGRGPESRQAYEAVREAAPRYLPALQVALLDAVDRGDAASVKGHAAELLALSSGDLVAALGSIAGRLPGWNDDRPLPEGVAEDMKTLLAHFGGAPPRIAALGFSLLGRIELSSGRPAEAAKALREGLAKRRSDRLVAWAALAVHRVEGPAAALRLLGSVDAGKVPEVARLKARCHLDLHHVSSAAPAVAAIGSDDGAEAAEIAWIFAVRSGDAAKAKAARPDAIGERLEWIGLEMHDLLREGGDADGIEDLAGRFENTACADAIRAWHTDDPGRLVSVFESKRSRGVPCVAALTARLMRGHLPPDAVREAAEAAVAASGGDLRARIDRALAVWLTDGQAAALKALDEIAALGPEDGPLLAALGEAYVAVGAPARAAEILSGCRSARCVAVRVEALRRAGDPGRAAADLDAALGSPGGTGNPGLAAAAMARDLEAKKLDAVIEAADRALPSAGRWTAEIAGHKAAALSAKDERGDADRAMLAAADRVVKGVGVDEAWEAKLGLVRANLERGGKFSMKAFGVAFEMYKFGVKDAELSYSYAVANIEQGNERGALRYLREAVELNPSFVPAYTRLKLLGKLTEDLSARLERTLPGVAP